MAMRHELHTEIEIDATPAAVWQVLTDLEGYAGWNPFITSSVGEPQVGTKLINRLETPEGKAMTFKPRVTVVETGRVFEWLGSLGFPGIFDGRHRFEIAASPNGTMLAQTEKFSGVLVRFFRKSLDTQTKSGFEAMNLALKTRVESVAVS
jgi:hypothetical protein